MHHNFPKTNSPKSVTPFQKKGINGQSMPMTAKALQMKQYADLLTEKHASMLNGNSTQQTPVQRKEATNPNGMPESVQGKMETAFNTDFSTVQLHTNSSQARDLGALAYTQGENIHFAPGQLDTNSLQGQKLLGHELTHVVQQREGRVEPTKQMKGMEVNDEDELEREADERGGKAAQMKIAGDAGSPKNPIQHVSQFLPVQFYRVADPTDPFNIYKNQFNTLWDNPTYAALDTKFDDTLNSKGPRSIKARKIFEFIYGSDPTVQSAYDGNLDEIKFRIDNFNGPDGLNRINSSALATLIGLMTAPTSPAGSRTPISVKGPKTTPGTLDDFTENIIKVAAEDLTRSDTEEINKNHSWTLLIEETAEAAILAPILKTFLLNAFRTKAAITTTTTVVKDESTLTKLMLSSKDQQKFIESLDIKAKPKKKRFKVDAEKMSIEFWGKSSGKSTGLNVESEIKVNPGSVVDGPSTQTLPWPADSKTGAHHPFSLWNDPQNSGKTDFEATLNLRFPNQTDPYSFEDPATHVVLPTPSWKFAMEDDRLNIFSSNLNMKMYFKDQGDTAEFEPAHPGVDRLNNSITVPDTPMNYFGGRCPIAPVLILADGKTMANKGLPVEYDAEVLVGGASVFRFPRSPFGKHEKFAIPNWYMLQETSPTSKDKVSMVIYAYQDGKSTTPFKQETYNFVVGHAAGFTDAAFVTMLKNDTIKLNEPETVAGSLRYDLLHMTGPSANQAKRTLTAINAGRLKVGSLAQRPSIAGMSGVDLNTQVAWTYGNPLLTAANIVDYSFAEDPMVAGVRSRAFGEWIYVNRIVTYDNTGAIKTTLPNQEIIDFLIHESIHEMDYYEETAWQLYQDTFLSYWPLPKYAALTDTFDGTMDLLGPRSKKSRAIFDDLIARHKLIQTYYANSQRFKDLANQLLLPTGIVPLIAVSADESNWLDYQTEFRAYWFEGSSTYDSLSTEFDNSLDSKGPRSKKSRAIFEHLQKTYDYVNKGYKDSPQFRGKVDQLMFPDGINLIVSVPLDNLWNKILAYNNGFTGPAFATHKADLTTDFGALTTEEAHQINANRAWRELVEKKYGPTTTATTEVKGILNIPI